MKNLKSFENFINENLHRSQDDPSANVYNNKDKEIILSSEEEEISHMNWESIDLTPEEIKFLIFIYNNFDSGGPVADKNNWMYINFEHGENMMKKVIKGEYKKLNQEITVPIAQRILSKMNEEMNEE